jgi:hypothetical protein
MLNARLTLSLLVALAVASLSNGFAPKTSQGRNVDVSMNGIFDAVGEFFEELDAFVDDATSRRLGAGAKFYGKRKSKFYGTDDTGRKKDKTVADPLGEQNKIVVEFRWRLFTYKFG